jgi:hypothetical protein
MKKGMTDEMYKRIDKLDILAEKGTLDKIGDPFHVSGISDGVLRGKTLVPVFFTGDDHGPVTFLADVGGALDKPEYVGVRLVFGSRRGHHKEPYYCWVPIPEGEE